MNPIRPNTVFPASNSLPIGPGSVANRLLSANQKHSSTSASSPVNAAEGKSFLNELNKVEVGQQASDVKSLELDRSRPMPFEEAAGPMSLQQKTLINDLNRDRPAGTIGEEPKDEREALQQFVGEAFYGIMIKQMRNSVWKSDLMGNSSAQKQFEGQFDQLLVQNLASESSDRMSQPFYDQMMRMRNGISG